MKPSLEIQEIAIAIAAKQHNPTILTRDFLKYSGIVPSEWELARQPIVTNTASQVVFQNGINIVAEVNRIIFVESIATKEPQDVEIPAIASKYLETLAQVDYQGISINFRGHVLFDQQQNTARDYILKTLLNPGTWQEFGKAPVQAATRFLYTLEDAQMTLDINEAGLQLPDNKVLPIVLFSANFGHAIAPEEQSPRLATINQVIGNWQTDLETYQEVVNNKFLNSVGYQLNLAM
ncbi:hypothetical protein [aff. Roholtiella sp. LEGE 12411]|uniref:hypothetical protein n=1 Tax=aff. Roholtiella sp. LEGE 12411 TaxID=1828822 RepID=UPI001881D59C|nr:hypothetical protein [aff. Roholtiella sp. LEGE 12411]MBE9038673.1 hypothetical protein [aff. Roholtiella sp. LEGE 12411]